MRIALFCHSLLSDWNHGNAHFLRGLVTALQARGHEVRSYEPRDAWSMLHLVRDHGTGPIGDTLEVYPRLQVTRYNPEALNLDAALDDVDLVLVHEWNPAWLIGALGRRRARGGRFRLLFHDTHHRSLTAKRDIAACDLSAYDGVLAFGESVRARYVRSGWADRVWTWHEAADVRVFRPRPTNEARKGLVWIGNWGDDERGEELREFLIDPVRSLKLSADVYGVRYPDTARRELSHAGLRYCGWLANHRVPRIFANHAVTVHVPRRPYATALPGIPTIRPFEALACGIPLICAPWNDTEGLFEPGRDYLVARDGHEMKRHLRDVLHDPELARSLVEHGLATILSRHTCEHRVDELMKICRELGLESEAPRPPRQPLTPVEERL